MMAVWPRNCSLASTLAPWATSSLTGSALPVRAAVISAVSPSGDIVLGSAPACSSFSIIAALPFVQAASSGVTPYRFATLTSAPARTKRSTASTLSRSAAMYSAVVPSAPAAFTSGCWRSRARTAAVSPRLTASTSGRSRAPALTFGPASSRTAHAAANWFRFIATPCDGSLHAGQRLEFHRAGAVAELLHRHADLLEQRHVQVVHRRVLREPQVAAALELSRAAADQHERQIDVRVLIRIAQPAALQDHRVVQQRAVAVLDVPQPACKPCEQIDVVRVDLRGLRELDRVVLMVRNRVVRLGHADERIRPVRLLAA